jgi:hypothetical protein
LFIQNREIDGKENHEASYISPELEQRSKHAAAAAGVKRKSGQPAASKKPRVSTAHPGAAAAPPETDAKPLNERLAANRKRSLAEPQAEDGLEEGSPLKKPKAHKAKSTPGIACLKAILYASQ